jgi:hypothetical protein
MKRLDSLTEADHNVLDCRDMGHAWARSNDANVVMGHGGVIVEFAREDVCARCRAVRVRTMEVPSMRISSVSIRYPDDYLATPGQRWARADARREQYERVLRERDHVHLRAVS